MASLKRAIAVLGIVSVIGTATQVAKGKFGALLLGAEGVGVLNQLTALYGLMFIVAGFGFFNGMIRHIALAVKSDTGAARPHMNSVTLFLGAVSLAITAFCVLASPLISDLLFADGGERYELVALVLVAVPVAVQQRVFRAYLNATRDLKAISRAQMTADISSVAIFALAVWQFGIYGAVLAFVAMHALLLTGMCFYAVRSGGAGLAIPDPRNFDWGEVRANFGYGANGLAISFAASGTIIVIGRAIIVEYGLAEAGIFSVAWKVATLYLGALYAAAGSYYFPTLVAIEGDKDLQDEAFGAVALYMTILPPCMAGLIVFGDILIPLLFADEFLPAVLVMATLLVGDIFRVTSETLGLTLLARKKLFAYTGAYLFFAAGFIGLAVLLLPLLGIAGVALAYLAMQMVNLAVVTGFTRRHFSFRPDARLLLPFGLAIGLVAPLAAMEWLGMGLVAKLAVAFALGLAWLAASWQLPQFQSLLQSALRKIRPAT